MRYLQFLRQVHGLLAPPTYLEIGVHRGNSLALSRAATIGIDPDFTIKPQHEPAIAHAALFRETSDEYFARPDPLAPFDGRPISLAFIDGLHLVEFALRDFMNVERHSTWSGVAIFDDILPRRQVETNRDRSTYGWTGDIFKIPEILARHRPDLICLRVGTVPTGLLVVLGLDPESTVLAGCYDEIVESAVVPDPQRIPADIAERKGVLDPSAVLSASFWSTLRDARDAGLAPDDGRRRLRRAVRQDLGPGIPRPLRRVIRALR